MKKSNILIILLLGALLLAACAESTPTPDVEATAQAALEATQAAQPTDTPTPAPTKTSTPTNTPIPPTNTPTSTNTPVPPTNTPAPTKTPTLTPTPAPPTATSTPAPPPPTPTPAISPAEAHLEQGIAYYDQEKWDEAIAEFQEAIRLDPEFGVAYGWLGYSYALGPGDLEKAIAALEKYLQLVPEAEDRAQVEADLQQMRQDLAQASPRFEVPPGKALFVFTNYTDVDWSIDVGPYHLDVPAWKGGEYPLSTVAIDPGTYTWQAHSPGGGYYITDDSGNTAFEFTVAAGEIYPVDVR